MNKEFITTVSRLPGNRVIPENYDKAKTTKKYFEIESLIKEL